MIRDTINSLSVLQLCGLALLTAISIHGGCWLAGGTYDLFTRKRAGAADTAQPTTRKANS